MGQDGNQHQADRHGEPGFWENLLSRLAAEPAGPERPRMGTDRTERESEPCRFRLGARRFWWHQRRRGRKDHAVFPAARSGTGKISEPSADADRTGRTG